MAHDAHAQWPHESRLKTVAASWALLMPGADGALACEKGLHPHTEHGFCIMHCDGRPTPLAATLADNPGTDPIAPHRLVHVAVCSLILSIGPLATVAFAKKRHIENPQSTLWAHAFAAFMPAVGLAPPLAEAALIQNPWQREFVCAAAYRLQRRCGPTELSQFFDIALQGPWVARPGTAWIVPLARWIKTRDVQWAVTSRPQTAFVIVRTCPIAIHRKDRILLLLMAMFCNPTRWGERSPASIDTLDMPAQVRDALNTVPHILTPARCPLHKAIAACCPNPP